MKHAFTIIELLVVISIISILSLCSYKAISDNYHKMEDDIVNIVNKENIIEVYLDDVLIYEGEAKGFDLGKYKLEQIDGNKYFVKDIDYE